MKSTNLLLYVIAAFAQSGALPKLHYQAQDSDVNFYFYSTFNPVEGILVNISDPNAVSKTTFSSKKYTFFCVHGWHTTENSSNCQSIKNNLLLTRDINVFVLDWDSIAGDWFYPESVEKVQYVGKKMGSMISDLVKTSRLNLDYVSFAGHSLGAHIVGVAGRFLNGHIDYIVGLDPAGPLFTSQNIENRLGTDSAKFVEAIHTNGGLAGYYNPMGHADFYLNGGVFQPMCSPDFFGKCSHLKAVEYYGESILTGLFKARKCDNYDDYEKGKCNNNEISMMGQFNVDRNARGTYYLDTNLESPYAKKLDMFFLIIVNKILYLAI